MTIQLHNPPASFFPSSSWPVRIFRFFEESTLFIAESPPDSIQAGFQSTTKTNGLFVYLCSCPKIFSATFDRLKLDSANNSRDDLFIGDCFPLFSWDDDPKRKYPQWIWDWMSGAPQNSRESICGWNLSGGIDGVHCFVLLRFWGDNRGFLIEGNTTSIEIFSNHVHSSNLSRGKSCATVWLFSSLSWLSFHLLRILCPSHSDGR